MKKAIIHIYCAIYVNVLFSHVTGSSAVMMLKKKVNFVPYHHIHAIYAHIASVLSCDIKTEMNISFFPFFPQKKKNKSIHIYTYIQSWPMMLGPTCHKVISRILCLSIPQVHQVINSDNI